MPNTYTVKQLLSAHRGTYGCIDVRCAVIREDRRWQIVALSIHLRADPASIAEADFGRVEAELGRIDCKVFRIVQQCFSVGEIGKLQSMLVEQEFRLEGLQLTFENQPDLMTRSCAVRVASEKDLRTQAWPRIEDYQALRRDSATTHRIFSNDPQVLQVAEFAGYGNPVTAVRRLLNIDFSGSSSIGGLWTAADVPLSQNPTGARRSKDGLVLTLNVVAHTAVKDITCVVRRMSFDERELLERKIATPTRKKGDSNRATWSGDVELQLSRDDAVLVDVMTKKLGAVLSRRENPFNHLPREQANPLYAALTLFCSEAEVETLLRDPEKAQAQARLNIDKNETTYEVSIQWLLSLLGYRTIWLHRYQTYRSGKIDIGSVDCLAYSHTENLLLLVNCTLLAPHSKEVSRYAEVRERVANELFADSTTQVEAVVFTGCHADVDREEGSAKGVRIVHREEVGQLLAHARTGQPFDYARFVHPIFGHRFRD